MPSACEPNFAKPRLLLAEVYEKKGDKASAVKYYKEYLQVFPDAPDAKKIQKIAKFEKISPSPAMQRPRLLSRFAIIQSCGISSHHRSNEQGSGRGISSRAGSPRNFFSSWRKLGECDSRRQRANRIGCFWCSISWYST